MRFVTVDNSNFTENYLQNSLCQRCLMLGLIKMVCQYVKNEIHIPSLTPSLGSKLSSYLFLVLLWLSEGNTQGNGIIASLKIAL